MTWVFVYGSLMWDWDLDYVERSEAVLEGYHREFNKKSVRNWGTRDSSAHVLGLEEGGECKGVAYKLPEEKRDIILSSLDEREGSSYRREESDIRLEDGRTATASVYINRKNHTYIGDIPMEERVKMSLEASGRDGTGEEYVRNTYEDLQEAGIDDPYVSRYMDLMEEVEA